MAKATNDGTCQICGSRQRLPNGRLAKHGYTTRWGFFSGTCTGSDGLPFEQSTDLIERAIHAAEAEAAGLRDNAADQRTKGQDAGSRKTMASVYQPATWTDRHSRYDWQEVEVLSETKSFPGRAEAFEVFYAMVKTRTQNGAQIEKREDFTGVYGDNKLARIVMAGRESYAKDLEKRAEKFDGFVRWQTARVAAWKPAPLLERAGGR